MEETPLQILRRLLARPRWNQSQVATMLGVSQTTISRYLASPSGSFPGAWRLAELDTVEVLCRRCDKTTPAFVDGHQGPGTQAVRFCGWCGDPTLPLFCAHCGRIFPRDWPVWGWRCCSGCGARLPDLEGETPDAPE